VFLKTLTIKGFKSFAEATTLAMEPGVTVVVGPNGSGKSNVVDAIGWVLGAQAPSTVRSQKMDDVIFAGTAKRPALGRAEVSLTIDNSAGLLNIEFSEVTVTRTLFRNGESEYALNGAPCRLLDVQDLLSDTGVGRQQHVIINQGQIDAVLNARPEERRLVIEEAAGVLKFRRRKEKAERRLTGTEANLTRLADLLREVRRNLRPLERQADAARRHGAVVAELTALRTYLAGQDLARLRSRLAVGQARKGQLADEERAVRAALAELDATVLSLEGELHVTGTGDLSDVVGRFEGLRERGRGLAAVIAERRRSIERDQNASVDQTVVDSLQADAAHLRTELDAVTVQVGALAPDADALVAAEQELGAASKAFSADWAGGVAEPGGHAAEVRGELSARRGAADQTRAEVGRARDRLLNVGHKRERLDAEASSVADERAAAERTAAELGERLAAARAERAGAEQAAAHADGERRAADAERHQWTARAQALASALDEVRARAGAEQLGAVEGVLGTLVDLVHIDHGWEAAVEAALGEALLAAVAADEGSARRALAELDSGHLSGAVIALGPVAAVQSLTGPNGASADAGGVGDQGGHTVRPHVTASVPGVDALLDRLLNGTVAVAHWRDAVDALVAHPHRMVVTRDGGRFSATGWRVGSGGATGAGATAAGLAEATQRAAGAVARAEEAESVWRAASVSVDEARRIETARAAAVDRITQRQAVVAVTAARLDAERGDAANEEAALAAHTADLSHRAAAEQARIEELTASLATLEAEEAEQVERGRAMAEAQRRLAERAAAVQAQQSDLGRRRASLDERREFLEQRLAEVDQRLRRHVAERRGAEERRSALQRQAVVIHRLGTLVADRLAESEAELARVRAHREAQSEATRAVVTRLEAARGQRAGAERLLDETRERLQRAELEHAETALRVEAAVESLRRELDVEPDRAMAAEAPPLADGVTPAARTRELERDLRLMGPINPLALEELEALQERHQFLEEQLDDVRSTRRDLAKIIKAIDDEIVTVFSSAYVDVAENFGALFQTLFPGGSGRLTLTDPDNLLDTGIEVEARPSGKNVRKLSLLSGGERSLTALAYLFAVFRARPSPFYVMDEVEAALDDVNLHRFLDLVAEFRAEAQLIVVSHQKRTMEAADCLLGVTMQPGGSSKVISERVSVSA